MAHILAQVTLPYLTGLPEDVSVNTWSFDSGASGTTETVGNTIGAFLFTFYSGIVDYLSPTINTEAFGVKLYDRADPEPRTPWQTGQSDLGTVPTEIGLPEEVATCFSFRGVLASGAPPARRRGRVFLGPLNTTVLNYTNRTSVAPAFITDVFAAYNAAWDELDGTTIVHEVWSPTNETGYTVAFAWMDDAFDTQRRRGVIASGRVSETGPFGA